MVRKNPSFLGGRLGAFACLVVCVFHLCFVEIYVESGFFGCRGCWVSWILGVWFAFEFDASFISLLVLGFSFVFFSGFNLLVFVIFHLLFLFYLWGRRVLDCWFCAFFFFWKEGRVLRSSIDDSWGGSLSLNNSVFLLYLSQKPLGKDWRCGVFLRVFSTSFFFQV